MDDDKILRRAIGRRRLLRRAAGLAAGVAGAGAVSAAVATPAQANAGDPVLAGNSNDAGTAATTLTTNSATNPVLVLNNTAPPTTDSHGLSVGAPNLQFTPSGDYTGGPVGSMGMSHDGFVWIREEDSLGVFSDPIRTFSNSTFTTGFSPVRMLDTRPGEPAVNRILNPGVLDSAGNIKQGQILQVSLDDLFVFADSAFINVTLLAGPALGYITLFPSDKPLPLASNINFSPGQLVNNFALVGLGPVSSNNVLLSTNTLSIFSGQPSRIIIDVLGAVVFSFSHIKSIPGFTSFLQAGTATRKPPPGIFHQL